MDPAPTQPTDVVLHVQEPQWYSMQQFVTSEPQHTQESDTITAVEFSPDGEHIAIGDKGGRIWIHSTEKGRENCRPTTHARRRQERHESKLNSDETPQGGNVYDFYGQFQSHDSEFDYLKSLEIEERINSIAWCSTGLNNLTLLAANDKTVKLWKIFEKTMMKPSTPSFVDGRLHVPKLEARPIITAAIPRRVFANGHKYHIHSVSVNADGETFISADDLRINLWHIDSQTEPFLLCDLKPEDMESIKECVTCAFLHPQQCNVMAYTTSRARTYLCDLRSHAHVENSKEFSSELDILSGSLLGEIATNVRYGCFAGDGSYLITRDYLNVRVWDIRNEAIPLQVLPVHSSLEKRFEELYENEALFHSFNCGVPKSTRDSLVVTGSYGNSFVVMDYENLMYERIHLSAPVDPNVLMNNRLDASAVEYGDGDGDVIMMDGGKIMNADVRSRMRGAPGNPIQKPDEHELSWSDDSFMQRVPIVAYHPRGEYLAAINGPVMYLYRPRNPPLRSLTNMSRGVRRQQAMF